jgi:phenylpropionate dioxygenase-like ring-hydroxylating dioxygenase large terminal subunit
MRIRDVETKAFFAQFLARLFVHNFFKDAQLFLPRADYERRHGTFPRYFSGWYLFVPSKDLAAGEIVHKKLNGLDLVAYRDREGRPVIHSNRCTHMDGLFAPMGEVKDGKLVCAYHRYAFDAGRPVTGPREFRGDPSKCIPCHAVVEVNDLIMFWYDASSANGVGAPAWQLRLPDVSRFPRRAFARSITPTHMAPLHENIVDDQHFMLLHKTLRYKAEPKVYHDKQCFSTKNTMRVPTPKLGPFRIRGVDGDEMDIRMDTEFHGLGVHINYAQIGDFEARIIHCTTPIEDEVTEWTICMYMEPRTWRWSLDVKTFMNIVYPWAALAQTYYLHTQDRRAFFEAGEYRFYEEVPKGFEKVNMFRRWIQEELLGEPRPAGKHTPPTTFVPRSALVQSAERKRQPSA